MAIERVAVIGAGTVGSQLAFQCALGGLEVGLWSRQEATLERGVEGARRVLRGRVEKGKLAEADCDAALARVKPTISLEEAAAGIDFAVEAVAEQLDAKREIFSRLGVAAPEDAVLATTSSTIGISALADVTGRPDRCINTHFFNPVLVMDLVEVVRGPETSDATVATAMEFCRHAGRFPVEVEQESYGFIVNRVIFTAIREAIRLLDEGAATAADIDEACVRGLNWPMGPLRLADFIGLDVIRDAWRLGETEMADPAWRVTDELARHVDAGELGMKSGKGFFEHQKK